MKRAYQTHSQKCAYERFRFLRFSLSIGKCRFHERSKSPWDPAVKTGVETHTIAGQAEKVKSANVLQEVSPRAQPVSLLTAALVRLENSWRDRSRRVRQRDSIILTDGSGPAKKKHGETPPPRRCPAMQ